MADEGGSETRGMGWPTEPRSVCSPDSCRARIWCVEFTSSLSRDQRQLDPDLQDDPRTIGRRKAHRTEGHNHGRTGRVTWFDARILQQIIQADESTRTERLSHSTDHREKSTEYRFRVHSVCCVVPCFREDRLCECSSTGGGVMADGSLHRRLGGPEPPGGRISIQRLRVSGTTLQASAHGVRGICSRTPYHEAGRDRTIITGAAASVIAICPCMGRKTWLRGHLRQGFNLTWRDCNMQCNPREG